MNNIVFICPYFGQFPKHFDLWLKSCEKNEDCKWIIYTDDKRKFNYPKNVEVNYCELSDLKKMFSQKLGFDVSLNSIKKLGDYKPLFGFLFEDKIKEFKSWGHLDVNDSIYGQITKVVTVDVLSKYDKIMCCGHMSIYRNTKENNRKFMLPLASGIDYKKIFTDEKFYNFEEVAPVSITRIFVENDFLIKNLTGKYADISFRKYNMVMSGVNENFDNFYLLKHNHVIFTWEDGCVFGYFLNGKKIEKKEFAYIHIKRRKLAYEVNPEDNKFIINQNGFFTFEEITPKYIMSHDKSKFLYKPFIDAKIKEIKNKRK